MNDDFLALTQRTPDLFEELDRQPRVLTVARELPKTPAIYVFWEGETPMHVGRAKNLQQRIRAHHAKSHNSAAFAFKLTRAKTGFTKATYTPVGSRAALMKHEPFRAEFEIQSHRVRTMFISHLRVDHPLEQYFLELYAALQYGTSLTEFETS